MRYFYLILTLLIAIMLNMVSCEPENTANCHKSISVQNNSNINIYYYIWPDTTLVLTDDPHFAANPDYRCAADHTANDMLRDCWEPIVKNSLNGKLSTYIFDAHIIETVSWDSIKSRREYLKRYDYSLTDFQLNDWIITYK
jgi:hypothetical protein